MNYYKIVVYFQNANPPFESDPGEYEVAKYYRGDRALNIYETSMVFYDTFKFSSHPRSYTFTGKDITEITSEEYDKASLADKLDSDL